MKFLVSCSLSPPLQKSGVLLWGQEGEMRLSVANQMLAGVSWSFSLHCFLQETNLFQVFVGCRILWGFEEVWAFCHPTGSAPFPRSCSMYTLAYIFCCPIKLLRPCPPSLAVPNSGLSLGETLWCGIFSTSALLLLLFNSYPSPALLRWLCPSSKQWSLGRIAYLSHCVKDWTLSRSFTELICFAKAGQSSCKFAVHPCNWRCSSYSGHWAVLLLH